MASYEFLTTWCVDAPIGSVFEVLRDSAGYPRWWNYDWRVRTTKAWMNIFGPVARPAFRWNHDLVMRQGGEGLAAELGVRLLAHN